MATTCLITEAARQAIIDAVAQFNADLAAHIAKDLSGHDQHVIINQAFLDSRGDVVAAKTLKIGVKLAESGYYAYALVPAIPE
jgi:hypothetical protein